MDREPLEFVNVAVRIKPLTDSENASKCLQIISQNPPVLFLPERPLTFNFDHVYSEGATQKTIFEQMVKPFVKYVRQGYNCTVFANGQTGTGKTYTIGTDPYVKNEEDFGLIPRTLNEFFEYRDDDDSEVEISLSFIEIYNEKVFDLLLNDKPEDKPLQVKGLKAQGFCQERVYNSQEAKHFLKIGNKNRHTAETKQNAKSSRSHAIFTIYCNVKHKDNNTTSAKLNLVDLAGSESIKKTGNQGSTFQEGVNINRGLLSIGQVMTALSTNASHIPYRQSIITSILKDSLNTHNYVSLIACVSSLAEDSTETSQTLEFAQRVKKMKNKPEVNEVISQYRRENPALFSQPRTSGTPFKRPAPVPTPRTAKRPRMLPLTTIDEPSTDNNVLLPSQSHSSTHCSLSSSHVSSISNVVSSVSNDTTQQNLSPVIKKYLSAMESSLMGKLELIIKSTLKRPSRIENSRRHLEDVENTPCVPWNKIQNEVSKLVRTELAQLTTKGTRATSSPIEEHLSKIRKVLSYGSPFTEEVNSLLTEKIGDDSPEQLQSNLQDENIAFKVPDLPLKKKKIPKSKRTPSISPIEIINKKTPRRSVRLSMNRQRPKKKSDDFYWDSSSSPIIRGLALLESTLKNDDSLKHFEHSRRRSVRLKDRTKLQKSNINSNVRKTNLVENLKEPTKKMLTVADTPAGKRLMQKTRSDSPCTAHTREVLTILNSGNVRKLETLNTIGSKTAQQIVLFRSIRGTFGRISDLNTLPGWGTKKFDKFVEHNFIKRELI
ncbi:unnamed protein product [Phaedon cochleariae]|uniref:Kinesin-like protein n=1 Tax=Phaedon cochleariae TaxID=80249 RepID=A0A9N9SE52_PHACE|nr:unnamed protein product [Phaedon cochleariae]